MISDPIADMLTRIRNANRALIPHVEFQHSKMKESLAKILKSEGYLDSCEIKEEKGKRTIRVGLKFTGRKGVIAGLKRVSRPGLRRFVGSTDIPRVLGGMGVSILSTSSGVMTGHEARKKNLGGELLCFVW